MKAAITDGKGKVWIDEAPMPVPNDYQCLCRIDACATCSGTDRKIVNGKLLYVQDYPGILGHESVGTVIETGSKVRNIEVGDRFLRVTAAYVGTMLGEFHSAWGCFAEYGLVTDGAAFVQDRPGMEPENAGAVRLQQKLPACCDVSAADATMLITLKESASFVAGTGIRMGQSMLILGSGSVALCMLRFAKIFGAGPVIVAGRRAGPLALAGKIGADVTVNAGTTDLCAAVQEATAGDGVDVILDAAGNMGFLKTAMGCLAATGKVAPYAIFDMGDGALHGAYEPDKDPEAVVAKEQLSPAAPDEASAHRYVMDAVRLSLLDLSAFYSHTMPLARIAEGFEMLAKKEAFKIVFEME